MKNHATIWILSAFVAAACTAWGCDSSSTDTGGGASMDEMAAQLEAQNAQEAARRREHARQEAARVAQEEAAAAAAAQTPPAVEVVTAHSPKKGRSLQGGGYLSVVTGTRFWAEHQMILNNIRHAVDLYEATNSRYPKTQDEFMREIIQANDIKLPELPDGYEYFYDPDEPLVLKMINKGSGAPGAVE